MDAQYKKQIRGSQDSYSNYYAGMNKTMRQKVALISSYFPDTGRIADMGSGSGQGSFDLANLFDSLEVVGVDISPQSVAHSRQNFHLPNLSFVIGDIVDKIFANNELDAILNSSVLHHVTSFNGFSLKKVQELLDNQVAQLKVGGILAIRDFVIPDGPTKVVLELPSNDGEHVTGETNPAGSESYSHLSTVSLFKNFCRNFKCADYPTGQIPYIKHPSMSLEFCRFEMDLRRATEFLLRKDYRSDWQVELLEEYLYFSQKQFEEEFTRRGLRILLSRPIFNPWIINNRWKNKIKMTGLDGLELPYPPTNYMIVGQKIEKTQGIRLELASKRKLTTSNFLLLESFKDQITNQTWDLISRPHPTLDIIPWFPTKNGISILARSQYPRPILQTLCRENQRENTYTSGFMTEPISFGAPTASNPEEIERIARAALESLGFSGKQIQRIDLGNKYLPSAGGTGELVTQVFVKIEPIGDLHKKFQNTHGFTTESTLTVLDAQQTLRAYCAGGMLDNRLELACYQLLTENKLSFGPWIGDEIVRKHDLPDRLADSDSPIFISCPLSIVETKNQIFEKCRDSAGYLEIQEGRFIESNSIGATLSEVKLEFVTAKESQPLSLGVIPIIQISGKTHIALERRNLPAAQKFFGFSDLPTIPAWRVPKRALEISQADLALQFVKRDFGMTLFEPIQLGCSYMPSAGTSPEIFHLYAAEINLANSEPGRESLCWYELDEIFKLTDQLKCGHLLTALFRLKHALGPS